MIHHLDRLLRQLFIAAIDEITAEAQVRFQPPDDTWRTYVQNLNIAGNPVNALNVYLVDLRDNRKLRSNERVREVVDGDVRETPAWRRMDCHYLISAWSSASTANLAVEPQADEHALLAKAVAAIANNEPLVPRRVYAPNPLPGAFPAAIADVELPTTLLPVEGFPKLAEFWGTMGTNHRWKSSMYLVVTLPILLDPYTAGPMVTTRTAEFRIGHDPLTAETWIEIGGHVRDSVHPLPGGQPAPLPNAYVELLDLTNTRLQLTQTNPLGRFTFASLHAGDYRLRATAVGFPALLRAITVPSLSGEYDLVF